MDARKRHQFFQSLFSRQDYLNFRNEIYDAEHKNQKLSAEQLEKCYEVIRSLFSHRPLCHVDILTFVIDAAKRADTSVMSEASRWQLETFIKKNIPWRFMFDAAGLYATFGKINDDKENPEFPTKYRVYQTEEEFAAALVSKDGLCPLDSRMHFLYTALKIDLAEFIDYAESYLKYDDKPARCFFDFEDTRYFFEDETLLPLLAAICRYNKATTDADKIEIYKEVFGHLKNLITWMHDFCCKVYDPKEFPRLPIMDTELPVANKPEHVSPAP